MTPSIQLVAFAIERRAFALELSTVRRVIRAMEVTPLPNAPAVILGVVNVQGEVASVVNLRQRFRLPARAISPTDHFILVNMPAPAPRGAARKLALVVDEVTGVLELAPDSLVVNDELVPDLEYVQGIAKVAGDLVFIHNLARCLSLHEATVLDAALAQIDR
jgi:purine-binding chemotaxis protein CheW